MILAYEHRRNITRIYILGICIPCIGLFHRMVYVTATASIYFNITAGIPSSSEEEMKKPIKHFHSFVLLFVQICLGSPNFLSFTILLFPFWTQFVCSSLVFTQGFGHTY